MEHKFTSKLSYLLLLIFSFLFSTHSFANDIPKIFKTISKQCKVPSNVLYALAITESTITMDDGTRNIWPYLINLDGVAYKFKSRKELYAKSLNLIKQGKLSFDIGYMQINYFWHNNRSKSLWELTDPKTNISIGCNIIHEGYKLSKNWFEAAGYYHSPTDLLKSMEYKKRFSKNYIPLMNI